MSLQSWSKRWGVEIEQKAEATTSWIAFGKQSARPVVLKVFKHSSDEQRSGELLKIFDGEGAVRVYEFNNQALLMERALPGHSLAALSLDGRDDEATDILARVVSRMSQQPLAGGRGSVSNSFANVASQAQAQQSRDRQGAVAGRSGNVIQTTASAHHLASPKRQPGGFSTAQDWGASFARYIEHSDPRIPKKIVLEAHAEYQELCATQTELRLLHGDLHHENVLFDQERGWLGIDPKGVIGETEFEIGAALRNPWNHPEFYTTEAVERRAQRFAANLGLDARRIMRWGFAQSVLAAIWAIEDGDPGQLYYLSTAR